MKEVNNGSTPSKALYDLEYELDSTRGRKYIFSSSTINDKKLYIINGNVKCDKISCES